MKFKNSVIGFLLVGIFQGAFAMKPAPFEDVDFKDPQTQIRVQSKKGPERIFENPETTVFDAKGKKLWSMPVFAGRQAINVSPDGKSLALIGNIYFGGQMQMNPKEVLVDIYVEGKQIKEIKFVDVIAEDPEKLAKKLGLSMKGGGWVDLEDFIPSIQVDWDKKSVLFLLYDKTTHTISF